ncbi:MAG: hypothetical protein M1829_006629 [Trizodia sp. TS-e1964]|nr:MAG: hypothetical protein M1829_006629 [Trizodia sp. TS-e1964]
MPISETFYQHDPTDDLPPVEKPHVWRLKPQTEMAKYQLWPPRSRISSLAHRVPTDSDRSHAIPEPRSASAMSHSSNSSFSIGPSATIRIKDNLSRRRKVNVPELGPMTTVQEASMDSPTIPGRPPLHERSMSAPSWRDQRSGNIMSSNNSLSAIEAEDSQDCPTPKPNPSFSQLSRSLESPSYMNRLPPLVIPRNEVSAFLLSGGISARERRPSPLSTGETGESPPEVPPKVPPKSPRTEARASSRNRFPYAQPNSSTSTLCSVNSSHSPARHGSPRPGQPPRSDSSQSVHTRNHSDISMMDRGRPAKRTAGEQLPNNGSPAKPKRSASADMRAFEILPCGRLASEATGTFPRNELENLQRQALEQAGRFEVLAAKDVDVLSRELQSLDERCDYLRKTYVSLRSGRRSLHVRMIHYLRSPRVAKFSLESLLKQEDALIELDDSIDDWVDKLEWAENRRMRVRQKLLEHVGAAATLQLSEAKQAPAGDDTPPRSPAKDRAAVGVLVQPKPSTTIRQDTPPQSPENTTAIIQELESIKPAAVTTSTPPRSPVACTAELESPKHAQELDTAPPAQELETSMPILELEASIASLSESSSFPSPPPYPPPRLPAFSAVSPTIPTSPIPDPLKVPTSPRRDVQSIRIYADTDVNYLLQDVQREIGRLVASDQRGMRWGETVVVAKSRLSDVNWDTHLPSTTFIPPQPPSSPCMPLQLAAS